MDYFPWEFCPEGLYIILKDLNKRYKNYPIYVTENGKCNTDEKIINSEIDDSNRIEYLKAHINIILKAINKGIDIKGYFVWSFLDNFEWVHGYIPKFGLINVDFKNQKRTPKNSAIWYSNFIKETYEKNFKNR